jgi:hypothetical protein
MKTKNIRKAELAAKIATYGATAAGLLAIVQPAAAAVQYSGVQNRALPTNNAGIAIDLNGDGTDDFSFWGDTAAVASQSITGLAFAGSFNQFVKADTFVNGFHSDPINFAQGYSIRATVVPGPNGTWSWSNSSNTLAGIGPTNGNFNGQTGFIGVRFHSAACQDASWHYGWIRFQNSGVGVGRVIDWAYEDVCDTPVLAGAGAPIAPVSVPTLGEWGMLIMTGLLSSVAIYRMRKDQKEP